MPKRQAAYTEWVSAGKVKRQAKRANDPHADEDGNRLYDEYPCIHGCGTTLLVTSYKGLGRTIEDHLRKCPKCPDGDRPVDKCQRGSSGALRSVSADLAAVRTELATAQAAAKASRAALKAAAAAMRAAPSSPEVEAALATVEAALGGATEAKAKKKHKRARTPAVAPSPPSALHVED